MAIKVKKRNSDNDEEPEDEHQAGGGRDPFVRTMLRAASWLRENSNLAIAGLIGIVLLASGGYAVYAQMNAQEVAASTTLSEGINQYHLPVKGSPNYKALEKSKQMELPDTVFESSDEKYQGIFDSAAQTLETYQSGGVVEAARLSKAAAALQLEKYEKAAKIYQSYFDNLKRDAAEKPFAYFGQGLAYAGAGDTKKAVGAFEKAAKASKPFKPLAMYQKGKVLEEEGQIEKAKDIYHKILDNHPKFEFKSDVERRIAMN